VIEAPNKKPLGRKAKGLLLLLAGLAERWVWGGPVSAGSLPIDSGWICLSAERRRVFEQYPEPEAGEPAWPWEFRIVSVPP